MREFSGESERAEHSHSTGSESLGRAVWGDLPEMTLAANRKNHKQTHGAEEILDQLQKDKIKYPPVVDPAEERKKLGESQKVIYDGLKNHDGILLSKALNGTTDSQFRTELEKVKWIFNEGMGSRNIAVGVDTEKVHVYGITGGGNPVQLYARKYDKANDLTMAPDYNDPVQRQKILKELQADNNPELKALNPFELELYAGMQKKDGMLIRGALSKLDPVKFDEQVSKISGIFNSIGYSYAIDVDRDENRMRLNWITMQGNPVELYGGPYPPSLNRFVPREKEYVRP